MNDCPVSVGDVLAGKYRVERILGQGGMGVVVAAWHIELEQRVAVKFLLPQFAQDNSASERFRREARAAVKIRSEHVARVIDVGTLDDGEPYMVMEYLEGKDLQSELEHTGCFEIGEAVEYVLQACLAMAEAHAKGMVHRDLKPANLFRTTRADGARVIKVLDFGISKSIHGSSDAQLSLTRTAAMIGSPLYMSPEQLESARDVDERADVWSLGVILFELLTGSLPFGGDTLPQLVRAVLVGNPPKAHELRPEIPEGLSDVVSRCILKNKDQRFSNVGELARELAAFLPDGERYADRVQKVLALSALPSAPTAPIAAVTTVSRGMPAARAQSAASGPSPEGPATDVAPQKFTGAGGTVDVSIEDPERSASSTSAAANASDRDHKNTVASWGGTQDGDETPKKRFPLAGIAVAAAVCAAGIGGWIALADPSAEARQGDTEEPDTAVANARTANEVGTPPAEQPVAVEPHESEPRVEPAEPTSSDGEPEASEPDDKKTEERGAEQEPEVVAATATAKPRPPSKVKPRPVTNKSKPASAKKDPKASDFTDFGGRR